MNKEKQLKQKFQIVSEKGRIKKSSKKSKDLSNEEMLLKFLKNQVVELEEFMKESDRIPLQKAAIIFCFGNDESFEESVNQFQFMSFNITTPEFFLLIDTMKSKYIQDLTQS